MLTVGLDVGATLCKMALVGRDPEKLETEHHPSADLTAVRARVGAVKPSRIVATGGGASELGERMAGVRVAHIPEFDAWGRGAAVVAAHEGVELPERYLLVSLGTGTSILAVDAGGVTRAGGTAVGGGTALGLARLLLGVDRFADLAALAARGDRRRVDLLVGEVYRGTAASIAAELTAANFGRIASTRPEDVAHGLMGLVGETVVLVSLGLARGLGMETVVYCGTTLAENPALHGIVFDISRFFGLCPVFLARGAFCGAVGAADASG